VFSFGFFSGRFDLIAADPLAAEYLSLMKKHGLRQTCPMIGCRGEELTRHLPSDHFDLVWSHNAIDHTQQPDLVFENMAGVTRPGGVVIIQCWEDEGTHAGWSGLHGFDFRNAPNGGLRYLTRDGVDLSFDDDRLELIEPLVHPLKNRPRADGKTWLEAWYRRR
jgi:SAM-dependent methyltransferase